MATPRDMTPASREVGLLEFCSYAQDVLAELRKIALDAGHISLAAALELAADEARRVQANEPHLERHDA